MKHLPKAELHLHLEGAATPLLVKQFAKRNNMQLPDNLIQDDNNFLWHDFLNFLQVYDAASSVIRTAKDYYDLSYHYLAQCALEGVIYSELMPSPDHAMASGHIAYLDMVDHIAQAIDQAEKDFGIVSRIYISGVRHYGPEQCEAVAKLAVQYPHPYVRGYGLGGDEVGFPPAQFARAYKIAHEEAGLACTVHAGEWTGPDKIREALAYLPVTRLGHGVRIIEDMDLVAEVIERGITLECCPTSNIALKVYPSYQEHPLRKLYDLGVRVTLGSDDPPYFHTTIGREYEVAAEYFGFNEKELLSLTANAISAGFVEAPIKKKLLEKIND